jgi:hypothetical protein
MTGLQHDLETLNLLDAGIFFVAGEIKQADLEAKVGRQVKFAMHKQFGWVLDSCEAAFDECFIELRVQNGREVAAMSLLVPDDVVVV